MLMLSKTTRKLGACRIRLTSSAAGWLKTRQNNYLTHR